ncbi:MAG: AtpZ/AtpI family protein [Candidatus Electrothrix sp. AUS3]|nr:AtpZ/AtpI family protein [Candidatus Electrothrix gigas]
MAEKKDGILNELVRYGQTGMTFSASIFIGFGMGWWLDNKLFAGKTAPWFSFIFLGFGIVAGFKHLWDMNKKISHD